MFFAMGRCKKILKFVFMSEIGVFVVRTVYCEITGGGAFTPPLGATIHMQQKIPELTFEDFGAVVESQNELFCIL